MKVRLLIAEKCFPCLAIVFSAAHVETPQSPQEITLKLTAPPQKVEAYEKADFSREDSRPWYVRANKRARRNKWA